MNVPPHVGVLLPEVATTWSFSRAHSPTTLQNLYQLSLWFLQKIESVSKVKDVIIIFCDSGTFAHAGHAFSQFKCSDFEIYPRVSQWRISQSIEDCHRCYQLKLSAVKCSTCKIDICRIVQLSLSPPAIPVANTIRPRPRRWKTYLSVQQLVTSIFCSSKQRQHKTWLQQLSAGWLKNV